MIKINETSSRHSHVIAKTVCITKDGIEAIKAS